MCLLFLYAKNEVYILAQPKEALQTETIKIQSQMPQTTHRLTILPYLIKWVPNKPQKITKVLSFDLDHTIIRPKKGRFSTNSDDWTFMTYGDKSALTKLSEELKSSPELQIVLFSNQGGVVSEPRTSKSCIKHVDKMNKVLEYISELDMELCNRIWIYCATKKPASLFRSKNSSKPNRITKKQDAKTIINGSLITPEIFESMRKPNNGMATEFINDSKSNQELLKWLFYCGDAAGRNNDFSDSDRLFAEKFNIPFKLPEEYFI